MKLVALFFGVLFPLFCIALPEKIISSDELDHGAVALDGLWAFDWQELHTNSQAVMRDGLQLPGLWSKQGPYLPQGFATLRLLVKLPVKALYYLRIPDVPSAISLWVNGQQLYRRGVVSNKADSELPEFGPEVVALPPADQYQLILHVSNFHHTDGGIWHNFMISNQSHKSVLQDQSKIVDAVIFSFLIFASVCLLVINLSRHGHVSHLLFAMFIWVIAFRSIMVGERIAYDFVSGVSWESWQRLEHILLFLALPLFLYFFHRFFSIKNMIFAHAIFIITLFLVASTLLYPSLIFTKFSQISQVLGVLSVIYILMISAVLIKQKVQYSIWFSASFIGAAAFVLHDYLYAHLFIQSRPLSQFGMISFVALQMHMLWMHRKSDIKLMMFVKSSIDHKIKSITQVSKSDLAIKDLSVSQWVLKIKPYCEILNVPIHIRGDNCLLRVDEEALESAVLIMARIADKNDMKVQLSISCVDNDVVFSLLYDVAFNSSIFASDDLNVVHQLLNGIGSVLNIKRLPKSSIFEFKIPIVQPVDSELDLGGVKFKGNELADAILYCGDDTGVLERSLEDDFYLVDSVISQENIVKYRPSLIIWQVNNWDAYTLGDISNIISEFPYTPILLVADNFHKTQLAQCIRLGISDYIITPVLPEELLLKTKRLKGSIKPSQAIANKQDIRDVTVQLTRNCIAMWQKYSNKSKVDLAESSRLWRVYVDGSTAKTRTLDKYLSLQSLPKNPRWETVSRTVDYVLEECELDDLDRKLLSQQLSTFNKLLAS